MKKWTVMLIPQGQGGSSSLTVCEFHFWSVSAFFIILAFAAAFFFQRHQEVSKQAEWLRQANRALELEKARTPIMVEAPKRDVSKDQVREVEARLRAEYDASIEAITAELSDLYEMEKRARNITGLAPRTPEKALPAASVEGGKGGGPSQTGPFDYFKEEESMTPPFVIYGMARPSADLIVEEIRVRTKSLRGLVHDMEAQKERIARVPSGSPIARGGRITSNFGYRRDPFSRRVRHHDGVDISAKKGTPVRATASGVVVKAEYISEYGNSVLIDHGDGICTMYAHLSEIGVSRGAKVSRGDAIGCVGSTGRSTGNHLHYEVHVNGHNVNPSKYLND